LLGRSYCEHSQAHRSEPARARHRCRSRPQISSERDLIELVEADIGIAMMPHTSPVPESLKRAAVAGLDARRTVSLYGVAGRQRTAVANAVMRIAARCGLAGDCGVAARTIAALLLLPLWEKVA
jgi:hypothetical protein